MRSQRPATNIKFCMFAVLLMGSFAGCSTNEKQQRSPHSLPPSTSVPNDRIIKYVILPTESITENTFFPTEFKPLWTPTTNDVIEALNQLRVYLLIGDTDPLLRPSYAKKLPFLRQQLPQTACQTVGITFGQHKGILLNCVPTDSAMSRGWEERFIKVYDGGPRWWSVVYLPENRSFTRLRIDLGY
jgi:hypothetical protein